MAVATNRKRKSYSWCSAIKYTNNRGKNPHLFFFSDFQKSHRGKDHTELICITIGSFIKVMWFRYSLDLDLASIQDSNAFRLINSRSRSIDI